MSSNSADIDPQAFVMAMNAQVDTEAWIVDSGASMHLTYRRDWIDAFEEISPVKLYLGDSSVQEATGKGTIHLELVDGAHTGHLNDVLYVPGLTKNLFSISKATEQGLKAIFSKASCLLITDKGVVKAQGLRTGNLYHLKCKVVHAKSNGLVAQHEDMLKVWHRRLGHLNERHLQLLHKEKLVDGLDFGSSGKSRLLHVKFPSACQVWNTCKGRCLMAQASTRHKGTQQVRGSKQGERVIDRE